MKNIFVFFMIILTFFIAFEIKQQNIVSISEYGTKHKAQCFPDGSSCKKNADCCSNFCDGQYPCPPMQICFYSCKPLSTCNGNCPSSTCRTCVCPKQQNQIDITQYCSNSKWDTNCCKCIIQRTSKGNPYYQIQGQLWVGIGILPIDSINGNMLCKMSVQQFCDWKKNKQCAEKIYENGKWYFWDDDAKACGC